MLDPAAPVPAPTDHLTVSDRWVIFARKRNDNFPPEGHREPAKVRGGDKRHFLPGPATTLVCGPEHERDVNWTPLSGNMGEAAETAAPEEPESPLGDLFFPKPYNNEQVHRTRLVIE